MQTNLQSVIQNEKRYEKNLRHTVYLSLLQFGESNLAVSARKGETNETKGSFAYYDVTREKFGGNR
jgi:hypothetical protein